MLKKTLFVFIICIMTMMLIYSKDNTTMKLNDREVKEITKACLDYVEGYFESSKDRIENGVHQKLVKRDAKMNEMTRDQLVQYAVSKKRDKPKNGIIVTVFDISGNIAIARIDSEFVDYAQLLRIDGKWQVINVLWDYFQKK